MYILEHELARVAGAQGELALLISRLEALAVRWNDEAADRSLALVAVGLRPHDGDIRRGSVGDPHFPTVEQPGSVGLLVRHRDHAGRIGTEVRLRETEAADHLAPCHARKPGTSLVFAAEGINRIHRQGALNRSE